MTPIVVAVLSYLLGSIPFAVVFSRIFGLADPRTYGSGNPGATNVLRSGNKAAALLTLLFDAAKGWAAVFATAHYGPEFGAGPGSVALAGLCAFAGHLYPVFLRFRGGKGVATAAGVVLALDWVLGAAVLGVFLAVVVVSRYVSLASIAAALASPILAYLMLGGGYKSAALVVMAALLVWRHRENIGRLVAGKESRLGARKDAPPAAADPARHTGKGHHGKH